MGDQHMGLQPRMIGRQCGNCTAIVHKSNVCMIFINQIREKIGLMFGNPETKRGSGPEILFVGFSLDIVAWLQSKLEKLSVGAKTKIKVVKNKVAALFREAEVDSIYGEGISKESDLIDLGTENGFLDQSGSGTLTKASVSGKVGRTPECS